MKKEQGKGEKGARDRNLKGAGSEGTNLKRSKEQRPPPNRGCIMGVNGI